MLWQVYFLFPGLIDRHDAVSATRVLQVHQRKTPDIPDDCYVAPNASLIGDVRNLGISLPKFDFLELAPQRAIASAIAQVFLNDKTTIWYGAVLRGAYSIRAPQLFGRETRRLQQIGLSLLREH
jgi:hypothetical protein